ncbi:MAG: ATP-binding protein, partial [Bacteroidota bacterium]|nr:ATP-binding protein [Bacteroidota bacterium]
QLTQTKWKDYAQQKGVYIGIKKEFAGLPIVLGSGAELREILTNLLLNAVDAMPSGGTITIRTLNQERLYSIEVEDTGIGMDSTTRLRIFDPFFTTKGNRGTGLGLAMVKTLVNKRQGEISVISKQGTGTKFTITFPKLNIVNKYLNKPNFTTSEIVKDMNLQPMKILINANYDVVLACDGREGVEKFKSGNIDIVFTDLGMSELNGWEVAKIVKTIKPNTPVVLISGWGSDLKDQDIKGTGVDFLASKPFHIDEIFKLLILEKKYIKDKKKDISV